MPEPLTARQVRIRLLGIGAVLLVLVGAFTYRSYWEERVILCPFRAATSIPCPGCGITRSFCSFAQGEARLSFGYHLFGPPLFLGMVALVPLFGVELALRRRVTVFDQFLFSRRIAWGFAAAWGSYHVVRVGWLLIGKDVFPV